MYTVKLYIRFLTFFSTQLPAVSYDTSVGSRREWMWSGAERSGAEWSGAEWSGGERSGVERSGVKWSGAELTGVEWSGAEWSGVAYL